MANKSKEENAKYHNIWTGMQMQMIGDLDRVALNNGTSRNDIIRRACTFLLKNKKKFGLK
jgi:hypothetical protein